MTELNGVAVEVDELEAARKDLAKACLEQPMDPTGAAISAYVTAVMTSARVNALYEYVTHGEGLGPVGLDAFTVKAMREAADAIRAQAATQSRIQVAPASSKLLKSN